MALIPRTSSRPAQILDELVRLAEDLKKPQPWYLRGVKTVRPSWDMAMLNDSLPGLFLRWEDNPVVDGAAGFTYQRGQVRMRYVTKDATERHRALMDGVSDVKLLFAQNARLSRLEWVSQLSLIGEEAPNVDAAERAGDAYCDIVYAVTYQWPDNEP